MENLHIISLEESPVSGKDIFNITILINNEIYQGLVVKKSKLNKEIII